MNEAGHAGGITRRHFLATGATLYGTLWASSGALLTLAPSRTWALELAHLDARSGRALLALTRHVYPHAALDDAVYALVVKALDEAAAEADTRALLSAGVAALDQGADGDWLAREPAAQLGDVHAIAGTPFFEKVRSTAVVALYNNALAFAHFGYEGPAFEFGGYLERGFDDLTWLPDPPAAASPAKA
ncbi:MAG: tat (twin-arginine translocation) pathway signal sequence [Gammaproteobacteria bacterium]|nr:tat (twin-arginine translocation) pathway signal sequence [Gammaproteobacteria bacterium]